MGGATAFMYKASVAIKNLEETILALLLQEGIPSKSTTASLGLVGKTIGNGVYSGNTRRIYQKQGTIERQVILMR